MKLRVAFYDEKISWGKNWIFLGNSYSKLKFAEKKIKGSRIKISNFLHESCNEELKNYLQWTENQRVKYKDSIYWWMTSLAGRNNADTKLFLYICQIISLRKILKNYEEQELLIVSDDILLIKTIIKNFNNHQIQTNNLLLFKLLKNSTHHYFKTIRNLTISILDIIFNFFCAKVTLKKKKLPDGNIYLLHQYAEVGSLRNNKNLQSRYFPYLKEYFTKENINLYCLYWFTPFWSGKLKAFEKIRKENCCIVEDWINIFDYLQSIKNHFRASKCFDTESSYPNIDIKYLVLREKQIYVENIISNLRFWHYIPAIKKWSVNCKSVICIDHYENMIYEHALIAAIRKLDIKTKIFGYHHALASQEFTAWHCLKSEWNSKFKPEGIISLGTISNKMLCEYGNPREKIINGPALRYNNILIRKQTINKKDKKKILVPISQINDAPYEMLSKIKVLCKELEDTDYIFTLKPHPNFNISKSLKLLGLKELPKNLTISHENLDKLLDTSLFTILMSTGASYDAVLNGNIVLNLKSELNLMDNYIDFFSKEFSFLDSHTLESIKSILLECISHDKKIDQYVYEFGKLRNYLIEGMNIVNEQNLSKFKLNN